MMSMRLVSQTQRRAVAFLSFRTIPVDLHKLREVHGLAKRVWNGIQVHLVAVRSQLHAIGKAGSDILKEVRCKPGIPPARKPANNELAICVNGDKRPNITSILAVLEVCGLSVLGFGPHERPNLIDLDATRGNVLDVSVVVFDASRTHTLQQAENSTLRHSSQTNRGAHGATLDQCRDNCYFLRHADYVCHEPIVRQRFRISKRKVHSGDILRGFLRFGPSRLCSLFSAASALFIGHGFESALAADLAALRAHLSHDLLNDSKLDSLNRFNGLYGYASGILDGIKFCRSAFPLWHMPQACHETEGTSRYANFK